MNTGALNAVREALAWTVCCGIVFGGVFFADEIVASFGDTTSQIAQDYLPSSGDGVTRSARSSYDATSASASVAEPEEAGTVYLMADQSNQFYADAQINDRSIRVLVDTGASHLSLRHEDAETLGIIITDSDYTHRAKTANGTTKIAQVLLDRVQIGPIVIRDVEAFVGEPGKKFVTLLGMSFLRRIRSVSISGREMKLAN